MSPLTGKISIGVLLIILGSATVVELGDNGTKRDQPSVVIASPPTEPVHSAAWYAAHPDALKEDSDRCGGNAASISPAACQNVAAAEEQLAPSQLQSLDSDAPTASVKSQ